MFLSSVFVFTQIIKATTVEQVREILSDVVIGPSQNFLIATVDGNITYQCPGKIPVRYYYLFNIKKYLAYFRIYLIQFFFPSA